jgi:hypothetical protein
MDESQIIEDTKDSQEKLQADLAHYRATLHFMGGNIPIEALCLPKEIETILVREGYLRVYDLFRCDLTKIKGLGSKRLALLTSRLDEFFSIGM